MGRKSKAVNFLKGIGKNDSVVIVFHNDVDGTSSAAILNRLVTQRAGTSALLVSQPMPVNDNIMEKIKTTVPTKIIFTDLAIDQQPAVLKKVTGCAPVMIIDHHIISKDMSSSKIVHYNPRFDRPDVFLSASYLAYKLCAEAGESDGQQSDALWISMVGIVADYNLEDSGDVIQKAKKKYKFDDPKKSIFSEIGNMIFSARATKKLSPEEICVILSSAESPEKLADVKKGDILMESNFIIQKEIDEAVSAAPQTMKKEGNVIIFEVRSKYNIRSPVSTIVSEKHADKLVLAFVREKGKVKFSARNQKKNINAGRILESCIKGFRGSAGGHEAAAAGILSEKDWPAFVQKVVSEANSS